MLPNREGTGLSRPRGQTGRLLCSPGTDGARGTERGASDGGGGRGPSRCKEGTPCMWQGWPAEGHRGSEHPVAPRPPGGAPWLPAASSPVLACPPTCSLSSCVRAVLLVTSPVKSVFWRHISRPETGIRNSFVSFPHDKDGPSPAHVARLLSPCHARALLGQ